MRSGAAAVIVGNEVLSAKVTEENGAHLIRRLRQRGIPLKRITFVPDEVDAIVDAVATSRAVARWVFTSGGIGPTHDDVTVRAVALALGRRVVRMQKLADELARYYGTALTPEALRLADAPEGTVLLEPRESRYPVLSCDGVFLLPGVPHLFRSLLETALEGLPSRALHVRTLYLGFGEAELAAGLDKVALAMPDVAIGSYPQFDRALDHRVKITIESESPERADEAATRLLAFWPGGALVRSEAHVLGENAGGA